MVTSLYVFAVMVRFCVNGSQARPEDALKTGAFEYVIGPSDIRMPENMLFAFAESLDIAVIVTPFITQSA